MTALIGANKMKLPTRENAFVPPSKLKDYLLSETHVVGRSKAKFFRGSDLMNRTLNYWNGVYSRLLEIKKSTKKL
jgi:hypothetical protein